MLGLLQNSLKAASAGKTPQKVRIREIYFPCKMSTFCDLGRISVCVCRTKYDGKSTQNAVLQWSCTGNYSAVPQALFARRSPPLWCRLHSPKGRGFPVSSLSRPVVTVVAKTIPQGGFFHCLAGKLFAAVTSEQFHVATGMHGKV